MVFLNYRVVPLFLQNSSFYAALAEDSDNFEVPENCYVETDTLNSAEDLTRLLTVLRYWDVNVVPKSLIEYCSEHLVWDWQEGCLEFEQDLPYLCALRHICQAPEANRLLLAVMSGNLDFVKYYNEKRAAQLSAEEFVACKDDENSYLSAIRSGNLTILKYLYDCSHPEDSTGTGEDNPVVQNRSFYTIDWVRNTLHATRVAAEHGQVQCLQFLCEHHQSLTGQEYTFAALKGHVSCIAYLHSQKCCWLPGVAQKATELGYWDCLQFAIENGCPIDNRLMRTAASTGRLDYLMYLYNHGGKLTEDCMSAAASAGHLSIMQYLHSHEAPWGTYVPQTTAQRGFVECLRFALEHGCPVEDTIANRAVGANQLPCVVYLFSIGYRASEDAVSYAHTQNWTELYDYLVEHNH